MPTVLLGNTAIIESLVVDGPDGNPSNAQATVHRNGDTPATPVQHIARPELGESVTTIRPPADATVADQLEGVIGAFAAHSSAAPSWVEGDSPELVGAVASHYGCPVGRPAIFNTT